MNLRLIVSMVLVVGVLLAGQVTAQARNASPATGQMVLCIGTGSVVVFVDADGQPTSAPHICPDCMLHALPGLEPFGDIPVQLLRVSDPPSWPDAGHGPPMSCGACVNARGPPVVG